MAIADFNGDGRLDIVAAANNQTPHFYTNVIESVGHWSTLVLVGSTSNRDAIGAKVTMGVGNQNLFRHVKTGSGFASQGQRALHFGLGAADHIDFIEITWPGGKVVRIEGSDLPEHHVDRMLLINEAGGEVVFLPSLRPNPVNSGSP